jgi:hypothetical protein
MAAGCAMAAIPTVRQREAPEPDVEIRDTEEVCR